MSSRRSAEGRAAGLTLGAMTLANAMILVDQTAVPLALPDITKAFGISSDSSQWVLNASLLPLAGLLVLGGRLGDLLGRRRIFLLGSILFAGASAVAGAAPTFDILLVARVVQGCGGALMLPATVSLLSAAYASKDRGRALGLMGGIAGAAAALGPTIGGALTSAVSWRAVFYINLPLLAVVLLLTLRAVRPDEQPRERAHVDLVGAALLCVTLVGLVFGLAQTTASGWASVAVLLPVGAAVVAAVAFVAWERRCSQPLMDLDLLRRSRNYRAATISQALAGMPEMGLGVILPLVLILNLGMSPGLAGLALIATTLPMVLLAPLAGSWYDKVGGRMPLVVGFTTLAASGVLLAAGVGTHTYHWLLPGLVVYGAGLAIVCTVNEPVSLDMVAEKDHGQASGVSATAEQGGGALGIALLFAAFHTAYVVRLGQLVDESAALSRSGLLQLREKLVAAEQTGLDFSKYDRTEQAYLLVARKASDFGYVVTFLLISVLAIVGAVVVARLVRKVDEPASEDSVETSS